MVLTITPGYAVPVAALYLLLWMRVSAARGAAGVSFGDGGNLHLLQRIRQHGNCAEWAVFVLLLMTLAESAGAPGPVLHGAGVLLLAGRLAHPFGLLPDNAGHPLRYVGNGTNLLAALACMGGIIFALFRA